MKPGELVHPSGCDAVWEIVGITSDIFTVKLICPDPPNPKNENIGRTIDFNLCTFKPRPVKESYAYEDPREYLAIVTGGFK